MKIFATNRRVALPENIRDNIPTSSSLLKQVFGVSKRFCFMACVDSIDCVSIDYQKSLACLLFSDNYRSLAEDEKDQLAALPLFDFYSLVPETGAEM